MVLLSFLIIKQHIYVCIYFVCCVYICIYNYIYICMYIYITVKWHIAKTDLVLMPFYDNPVFKPLVASNAFLNLSSIFLGREGRWYQQNCGKNISSYTVQDCGCSMLKQLLFFNYFGISLQDQISLKLYLLVNYLLEIRTVQSMGFKKTVR